MKGHFTIPRAPKLELHHQMKFNAIFRTALSWEGEGSYPTTEGCSQHIISLVDRVEFIFKRNMVIHVFKKDVFESKKINKNNKQDFRFKINWESKD